MSGRKNRSHTWAESELAENPTFAQGAPVAGACKGFDFTGTVTETRLAVDGAEKVLVEFDPGSAAVIDLHQDRGFFFAAELCEQ
jgi:hypothetical protein